MSILRTSKSSFTGGVFSPAMGARVDLARYQSGTKVGENVFVHAHGGMSNRAGFELISHTRQDELTVAIPFIANIETDETYKIMLSNQRVTFTRAGVPVLEPEVTTFTVTDVTGDANFNKTTHGFADGDYVVFYDATIPKMHQRTLEVEYIDADNFNLFYMNGDVVPYTDVTASTFTLRRRYSLAVPYLAAEIYDVNFEQDNDVMYLTHPNHPPGKLSRFADANWTYTVPTYTPSAPTPTGLAGTATYGADYDPAYAEVARYKVAAVSDATGEEGLPSASISLTNDLNIQNCVNDLTWDTMAGASKYYVYKDAEGVYGFIGATEREEFRDDNIVEDTNDGPQQTYNPFGSAGQYPRSVAIHEQRLCMASKDDDPQVVDMSKSTLLENFGTASPAKADDAISFRIRSRERQNIYAMVSTAAGLAMFSSTTEWMVVGGSQEDYLTPTNPVPRVQTRRGSYNLRPLVVGDVILYSQARGGVVREHVYSLNENVFNGPDRTILARHFFEKRRIISWCYAQSPYSIVWAVTDRNELLSCTYMREHDVWGWTNHPMENTLVDSVIAMPEGDEDAVHITCRRTIDGTEYAFEERMASRRVETPDEWFFADCALRYTGTPVDSVGGLWHLEGAAVCILADGNVVAPQIVTNGGVALGGFFSNVVVGLPYMSTIETLDLDLGNVPELGVIHGRNLSIPSLTVHVEDSRGMFFGVNRERMQEWKQRSTEDYGEATRAFTGKFTIVLQPEYNRTGNIVLQQRDPLPMTILAVAPDVKLGG